MINRVRQRDVHQVAIGEDALDLAAERLVHPVVVVGVQEAAVGDPGAQRTHLPIAEPHRAVPRHVDERQVGQRRIGQPHTHLGGLDAQRRAAVDRVDQVRQ